MTQSFTTLLMHSANMKKAYRWFEKVKRLSVEHIYICSGKGLHTNRGGGEIFRNCPYRPRDPTCHLHNGHWFFPGGKRQGSGVDYPHTSRTEV